MHTHNYSQLWISDYIPICQKLHTIYYFPNLSNLLWHKMTNMSHYCFVYLIKTMPYIFMECLFPTRHKFAESLSLRPIDLSLVFYRRRWRWAIYNPHDSLQS